MSYFLRPGAVMLLPCSVKAHLYFIFELRIVRQCRDGASC